MAGGESTKIVAENIIDDGIAFNIASNGDIGPADDLRNTFPQLFRLKMNVADASMEGFINSPLIYNHNFALKERHEDCLTCCWGRICDGGDLMGNEALRYSKKNGFRNKSVYCSSIEGLLTHMTKFLLKNGVSFEKVSESLIIN